MKIEVKIPDIAENVEKGIIATVLVAAGDKVSVDQPLVEFETDKATTDIPSPVDGVVSEVLVKGDDEVKVHQSIMIIEVLDNKEIIAPKVKTEQKNSSDKKQQIDESLAKSEKGGNNARNDHQDDLSSVPASPLARKIAREYNVDITRLEGTIPGQRITRQDVEDYIKQKGITIESYDQSGAKPVTENENASYEPMSNIRKLIARNTQEAWQTIPHVTQFDEVDITLLEKFRKENTERIAGDGGKLTLTALLVKITGYALYRFPKFNAAIDMSGMKIIHYPYFNIGIAVDTPKGLLIPVIKNVGKKSISEISAELTDLANKARDNKISLDELSGGTFTISNLGGIGGTGFTPIIYKPQVAILGVSKASMKQIYIDDDFTGRLILPLSLSYDHRLIDGADGVRFLSWIRNAIEKPFGIML